MELARKKICVYWCFHSITKNLTSWATFNLITLYVNPLILDLYRISNTPICSVVLKIEFWERGWAKQNPLAFTREPRPIRCRSQSWEGVTCMSQQLQLDHTVDFSNHAGDRYIWCCRIYVRNCPINKLPFSITQYSRRGFYVRSKTRSGERAGQHICMWVLWMVNNRSSTVLHTHTKKNAGSKLHILKSRNCKNNWDSEMRMVTSTYL